MPATLFIIQGFLGAGKTTFSKKFAEDKKILRLNSDEWVAAHFSDAQQQADWEACFAAATEKIWAEAEEKLRQREDVILDIGFWSRASRDHARDRARACGAACALYYIHAPDDVLLRRIAQRKGAIADRNLQNFHDIKRHFEAPAPEENAICIDTGTP